MPSQPQPDIGTLPDACPIAHSHPLTGPPTPVIPCGILPETGRRSIERLDRSGGRSLAMDPSHRSATSRESPWSLVVRDVLIARVVEELEPGAALDLGCGVGTNALMLARLGWQVTGIDISEEAIQEARAAARRERLDARFLVADVRTWEPDTDYDLVISTFSLPGGAEGHRFMATATAALKPGGTLVAVEWDHSMTERWGLDDDALPSPADIAAMVPGLVIDAAESREVRDLRRDDEHEAPIEATIAYLRAHKPIEVT